jgi:hypothetical protein
MHGMPSIGFDLNPVMVIVAKARLLPASEADSIEPLGSKIVEQAKKIFVAADLSDPLTIWFGKANAGVLRSLEVSIRNHLMGSLTHAEEQVNLDRLSSLAATNFVALFSVCRELAAGFRGTNPTWLRYPRLGEEKPRYSNDAIYRRFLRALRAMAGALQVRNELRPVDPIIAEIRVADTTEIFLPVESVDFALTSPPYCTRIDYPIDDTQKKRCARRYPSIHLVWKRQRSFPARVMRILARFLVNTRNHKALISRFSRIKQSTSRATLTLCWEYLELRLRN